MQALHELAPGEDLDRPKPARLALLADHQPVADPVLLAQRRSG